MRLELSGKLWKRELILFFTIVFYIILKKLKKKNYWNVILLFCNLKPLKVCNHLIIAVKNKKKFGIQLFKKKDKEVFI